MVGMLLLYWLADGFVKAVWVQFSTVGAEMPQKMQPVGQKQYTAFFVKQERHPAHFHAVQGMVPGFALLLFFAVLPAGMGL
ncbi:MAG: hypothetical protein IKK08_12775 [Clostridia bacterium]|nr:hypothetical protein [Clostridia bacterium]